MKYGIGDTTKYVTIEDASKYLGVSVRTMRNMRAKRVGPPTATLGGRLYYRVADLDAYIEEKFEAGAALAR